MAKTESIESKQAGAQEKAADKAPRDPYIVICRRPFTFDVPRKAMGLAKPGVVNQAPIRLFFEVGPTFLCASSTVWRFFGHNLSSSPPRAMSDEGRVVVEVRCGDNEILHGATFRGSERERKVADLEAALVRAMRFLGWDPAGDRASREVDEVPEVTRNRFTIAPGEVEADVAVMRISGLFGGSMEANAARAVLERTIGFCKSSAHLGALHDHAVLSGPIARIVAEKCRERGRSFKVAG